MAVETTIGLSSADVIQLINSSALFVGILAVGFSLVGALAVWRAGKEGAVAFFHMFERLQVLQLLTVMLVIASATVLALLGILSPNGITGILGGIGGYVLGGLNRQLPAASGKPVTASPAGGESKPAKAGE